MDKVLYMFRDMDGRDLSGPLWGKPGLDIDALAATFRAECYATAEAEKKDWCFISESDFVPWLIARGLVCRAENTPLIVNIATSNEHRYVPRHWPLCPACGKGRGEEEGGEILWAFNRREWFYQCTACLHRWGHHDEPYDGKKPMLNDDGRYTVGGCVPYAISQVGALPFDTVLQACRTKGWTEADGMFETAGLQVVRDFGLAVKPFFADDGAARLTVKQLLGSLHSDAMYIVSTRRHWFAVVRGENRDSSDTSPRSHVSRCWEVRT
jgi:hypothetical protein